MSQFEYVTDTFNPNDYAITVNFDDFTSYDRYASNTEPEQVIDQSVAWAASQYLLEQMQARSKAFEILELFGIVLPPLPSVDEYDFVLRVPLVPGEHRDLTDTLNFWAPLLQSTDQSYPILALPIDKEQEQRQFQYSRSIAAPNHPHERYDWNWLGHNLKEVKGDNHLTDYVVKPLDPVHNPRTINRSYPVQYYSDEPFVILTSPEGMIDWFPPDRPILDIAPTGIEPTYNEPNYNELTLQELIEQWYRTCPIPDTTPFIDLTPLKEEPRGLKRKRED